MEDRTERVNSLVFGANKVLGGLGSKIGPAQTSDAINTATITTVVVLAEFTILSSIMRPICHIYITFAALLNA